MLMPAGTCKHLLSEREYRTGTIFEPREHFGAFPGHWLFAPPTNDSMQPPIKGPDPFQTRRQMPGSVANMMPCVNQVETLGNTVRWQNAVRMQSAAQVHPNDSVFSLKCRRRHF